MKPASRLALSLAFALGLSSLSATAQIVRLERLAAPDFANTAGVSRIADDGTVLGTGWFEGMVVRWRPGQAPESLGADNITFTLENIMPLMSADGSVIAATLYYETDPGSPDTHFYPRTSIWQGGTEWAPVDGALFDEDTPFGISANGAYIVGTGTNIPEGDGPWLQQPWIWSAEGGMQALDLVDGLANGQAWTASNDGQIAAGFAATDPGALVRYGLRWDAGVPTQITDADGQPVGQAMACNNDCTLLVGAGMVGSEGSKQAWRWTEAGGVQYLGTLPQADVLEPYYAFDSSEDGRTIVGSYTRLGADGSLMNRSFLWTEEGGMVDLIDYLASHGIDYGANFNDLVANNITRDGTRILLNGTDMDYQRQRAIVFVIPRLFGDAFEDAAE